MDIAGKLLEYENENEENYRLLFGIQTVTWVSVTGSTDRSFGTNSYGANVLKQLPGDSAFSRGRQALHDNQGRPCRQCIACRQLQVGFKLAKDLFFLLCRKAFLFKTPIRSISCCLAKP